MALPRSGRWRWLVLGYVVLLAGAELCVTWSVAVGILCHGALLLALLNHYAVATSTSPAKSGERGAALDDSLSSLSSLPMLALLPILRIASVIMPSSQVSPIFSYTLVALALALGVALTCRLVGTGPADLKLRWTAAQAGIALLGVPLAFVALALRPASPVVKGDDWWYPLMGSVVLLLLGSLEEVIFRGMIQPSLCDLFGLGGILLAAGLSAAATSGSGSLSLVAFSGAVAAVFGFLVHRTGSVIGVAIAHGLVNALALALLANVSPGFGR